MFWIFGKYKHIARVSCVSRAGLTIWWALRTPQHRGPTGKLDAEEGERGGEGCPLPNQLGIWGALYKLLAGSGTKPRQKTDLVKFEIEKYITDDKDFGNFKKAVIVKMTCQLSTDNDF